MLVEWIKGPTKQDVSVGVVGPREMVERILLMGGSEGDQRIRLVGSSHVEERESYDKVLTIADRVDVVLFTGPLQFDLARSVGDLPVPGTYVPVNGASLYSSIIRGLLGGTIDPTRVSVDSISNEDVAEAYADIEVDTKNVHHREYRDPDSVTEFLDFHRQLYRRGKTSAALTTIESVARRLTADGVPAFRLVPSANTIRLALNTAALLGVGSKLEESQIVIIVVEVATSSRPMRAGSSNYWYQELVLELHRQLLGEIRGVGATVVQRDENCFVVTATFGSLYALTNNLRTAPFVHRVRSETGLAIDVGIGLGSTAHDAEQHGFLALEQSRGGEAASTFLMGPHGKMLSLPSQPSLLRSAPSNDGPAVPTKASETLERIFAGLGPDGDEATVVDAERVASAVGVTVRTARRMLSLLVDAGMAWPMPAVVSPHGGRPRQQFRLLTHGRSGG